MVFSPFSPIHLAADGRLFAELLTEHADGLAALDAKTTYRYVYSELAWQSRDATAYRHVFHGPDGERVVRTRHTRGQHDLGGLTAPARRSLRARLLAVLPKRLSALLPARLLLLAGLALACTASACTPPLDAQADTLVTSFTASPSFNNFREPCRLGYTLARPARVSLRVTKNTPDGPVLVAQLAADQKEPRGRRTADWRGVGPDGRFVPQGLYHVELTAAPATGGPSTTYALTTYLYRN